jgi:glycosyltransferase 2 family protein
VWGGSSSSLGSFEMPDAGVIVIVVLAVACVGGVLVLSSWGRAKVLPKIRGAVTEVRSSLGDLVRRPDRLGLLFGGAAMSKLVTIFAFYVSVRAFDVDMGFAQAGAIYMIANTIGSAVPTPGGVGGVEAALTATLVSASVDPATAAAVVLLFRMATFWAPTVPGYFFMRHAQRTGIV